LERLFEVVSFKEKRLLDVELIFEFKLLELIKSLLLRIDILEFKSLEVLKDKEKRLLDVELIFEFKLLELFMEVEKK
jgi:hypothetical protein